MAMTNRNNAKLDCMIYYTLDELCQLKLKMSQKK